MTIREYFIANLEPADAESIISQAIVNIDTPYDAQPLKIIDTGYFSNPLSQVILWSGTREGYEYWRDLNKQLAEKYKKGKLVIPKKTNTFSIWKRIKKFLGI